MKRLLVALSALAVTAATGAALSGSPAGAKPAISTVVMTMPNGSVMRMSIPASAAAASHARAVDLHRSVVHVKIMNFAFEPHTLVVSPGTHVVWTNEDSDPHTVTADHGAFASQAINTYGKYTLVARRTGTFTYHCQIHPFMHGTLVVQG